MKVCKFGGSSLATAAHVERLCQIVMDDADRRIVVVSAPGKRDASDVKVTDLLIEAAQSRLDGGSGEDALKRTIDRYASIAADLGLPESAVEEIAGDLRTRYEGATSDADGYMDTVKAGGEDNCSKLVAAALRSKGAMAEHVGPTEAGLVLSDEPGTARVLSRSYERLARLADRDGITVFPGFFGVSEDNKVVTFSRGGSDITGAVLARAVRADLYENFTDVDCICAADPRLVGDPTGIEEFTFREMRELSYMGFSVFHDEALEPVYRASIPVQVRNTGNLAHPGTRIVVRRELGERPVVGIAATEDFCAVFVRKFLMNREVGFGRRLLQILEDERIPFEHAPSGIDDMSVIVREAAFPPEAEKRVVDRIRHELDVDDLIVRRGLALVAIVGEGMRHTLGVAARACGTLAEAGVNIEMITQGSSEVSMVFGVRVTDVGVAVRALYGAFFGPVA